MNSPLVIARRLTESTPAGLGALVLVCALGLLWSGCSEPVPQEGDPCKSLQDCVDGDLLVCANQKCAQVRCHTRDDCPVGTACSGQWCSPPQCDRDEDCADEAICWRARCIDHGCHDRHGCPAGQVCAGEPPLCAAPPERCTNDDECPVGRGCKLPEGDCLDSCEADADCTGQTQCLLGLCRAPCDVDSDCPQGRTCHEGRCLELPDCSGQQECSGLRPYRNPQTCSCAMCLSTGDCDRSRGEVCTDTGECVHCVESAASEQSCAERSMVYAGGCCTECLADDDCTSAQAPYCARGRCVSTITAECIAHSDCADGLSCDLGRCVEPPSLRGCLAQSDCPEGEACYADGLCHVESQVCADCPAGSRCVAEPGDEAGTCAGCTTHCGTNNCPDGQVCFVEGEASSGYCVDATAVECG